MKLARPEIEIPTVYVQARGPQGPGRSLTVYDTTPEEVIDLLRRAIETSTDADDSPANGREAPAAADAR